MNKKTFWKSIVSFVLCYALIAPFMNVFVNAQEGNAKLVTRLQNRPKLRVEAAKFDKAIANLKPLAGKTAFDKNDIATIDAFIGEIDDGESIVIRAQSKAFAAAQDVKAFEDGVKAAAKGKNPQAFIDSLEENPRAVLQIDGATKAANAFTNSIKADAAILRTVGERLKAAGKKPISQKTDAAPLFTLVNASFQPGILPAVNASFQPRIQSAQNDLFDASPGSMKGSSTVKQTVVLEAALIALAAAYLGVQLTRLTTGVIGACVRRAMVEHRACIREERADGGGLSHSERLFCRGEFLFDAAICIILPV